MHLRIWFLDQTDGVLSRNPVAFLLAAHCPIGMIWGQVGYFENLRAEHLLGHHREAPVAVQLRLLEVHLDRVADLLEDVYGEAVPDAEARGFEVIEHDLASPPVHSNFISRKLDFVMYMLAMAVIPYLIFNWKRWL